MQHINVKGFTKKQERSWAHISEILPGAFLNLECVLEVVYKGELKTGSTVQCLAHRSHPVLTEYKKKPI